MTSEQIENLGYAFIGFGGTGLLAGAGLLAWMLVYCMKGK